MFKNNTASARANGSNVLFQAVKEVEIRNSLPVYISFDHDLGCTFDEDCNMIDLPSGYDFAKWIVEQDMNGTYKLHEDFEFNVHSANPVGKVNIEKYFNSYLKFKREKEAVNENS